MHKNVIRMPDERLPKKVFYGELGNALSMWPEEKDTSRQLSGKCVNQTEIPSPKTEVGKTIGGH